MRNRAYDADVQDETCTRAFFERRRALEREDSHIRKVVVPPPSSAFAEARCTDTLRLSPAICNGTAYSTWSETNPQTALSLTTTAIALVVLLLVRACGSRSRTSGVAATAVAATAVAMAPRGPSSAQISRTRAFVTSPQASRPGHAAASSPVRLVSYNLLGDGENLALSPKHDYCPRDLRVWLDEGAAGGKGRCTRLVEEISGYAPDVLCVQEVRGA